jgi:hypothetical protein
MADNEISFKITGDATGANDAADAAKEHLDRVSKSVDMLGDLIGAKVPDGISKMLASTELIGPALDAAFAPLAVISLGIAIFDATEKAKQHREELEKSRLEALDVALSFDKQAESVQISNLKLQDHIAALERRPTQNGITIAAMEGNRALEELIKSFQAAINKENELLTRQEQSFFDKLLSGDSGINGIIDKVKEFQSGINETMTKLRLATSERNKQQSAEYQGELNKQLVAYKSFLNDQLAANETGRQAKLTKFKGDTEAQAAALKNLTQEEQTLASAVNTDPAKGIKEINTEYGKTDQTLRSLLILLNDFGRTSQEVAKHSALVGSESQAEAAAKALKQVTEMEKLFFETSRDLQQKEAAKQMAANDEAIAGIDRRNKAFLKGVEERARASETFLQGEIKNAQTNEKTEEQLIEQRYLKGQINQQQEVALIAAAKEKELAIELQYEREILSLWHKDEKEKAAIEARISNLTKQAKLVETKAVTDSIKTQEQQYKQLFSQIGNALSSNVLDMLKGTETISQGFQKMYISLLTSLANYVAQKAEKKAEEWLIDKLFHEHSLGAATSVAAGVATVSGFASAMAALPFPINVSVAPGVGAAAGAVATGMGTVAMGALAASAGGDWRVDRDRLNFVHANETILPAGIAGKLRDMVEGGSTGGGVTVVVNHSVSAVDAGSFQAHIRRHSNMIANEVTRALKRKGAR